MNLYTISDLHLSLGADKPMDVFRGWENYVEKIEANWKRMVNDDDIVIVPGDTSWATKIEDTNADFSFLDGLPGKKNTFKGKS